MNEKRNKIESEIVLIAFDLNKYSNLLKTNPDRYQIVLDTQRYLRDIDQLHLLDENGNLIYGLNCNIGDVNISIDGTNASNYNAYISDTEGNSWNVGNTNE